MNGNIIMTDFCNVWKFPMFIHRQVYPGQLTGEWPALCCGIGEFSLHLHPLGLAMIRVGADDFNQKTLKMAKLISYEWNGLLVIITQDSEEFALWNSKRAKDVLWFLLLVPSFTSWFLQFKKYYLKFLEYAQIVLSFFRFCPQYILQNYLSLLICNKCDNFDMVQIIFEIYVDGDCIDI